jgi:hypothetical protein
VLDTVTMDVVSIHGSLSNWEVLDMVAIEYCEHMAIEMIQGQGMPVGREVFETCLWIGRFIQAYPGSDNDYTLLYRGTIKDVLCGSRKAKDSNIRQALLDRYPRTGGGKTPQIGTKQKPGPLFGMSTHAWPALAVGHVWVELNKDK